MVPPTILAEPAAHEKGPPLTQLAAEVEPAGAKRPAPQFMHAAEPAEDHVFAGHCEQEVTVKPAFELMDPAGQE